MNDATFGPQRVAVRPRPRDDATAREFERVRQSRANFAATGNVDPATATTAVQSPSYGDPDIVVTVHPNATQDSGARRRQTVARLMLAKRLCRPAKAASIVASMDTGIRSRGRARDSPRQPVCDLDGRPMRAHEQGTVLVMAQVDVNGRVSDARIVERSGSSILDRAAPNEVRRWKFSPALHDGQPIVASVEVPVSYRLDQ